MPEYFNDRKKGKHLSREERYEIQRGLREKRTFVEIALMIGCSPDTISKEIRNHRYKKPFDSKRVIPNRCKYRDSCRKRDICKKKKGHKCRIPCRQCTSCNKLCPDFVDYPCPVETKPPYVCNACHKSASCFFTKYLYNADYAQREYEEKLHRSREGIDLTKDELIALDELVSPLIKKGQPIAHIMESHREEIPCSERTLYTYIGKGYLTARNVDMRRTVRYKKRHRKVEVKVSPRKKADHHYRDYQRMLLNEPETRVVEMDTVEGVKGGKVQQTFFWKKEKLMLSFLLDNKDMAGTVGTLDYLEERLGRELFAELFPVILTDNGTEFADPDLFEYGKDGNRRTRLYYCEPRRSDQKGALEKNHEYIRYVLPKGSSFDWLTQEKVLLMINHINSTARPGLKGKRPIDLALQNFGMDVIEKLGLAVISPDDVNLTPSLLK